MGFRRQRAAVETASILHSCKAAAAAAAAAVAAAALVVVAAPCDALR